MEKQKNTTLSQKEYDNSYYTYKNPEKRKKYISKWAKEHKAEKRATHQKYEENQNARNLTKELKEIDKEMDSWSSRELML